MSDPLNAADFRAPAVLLSGTVDYDMYKEFRRQLDKAPETGLIVLELSTLDVANASWIPGAGRRFLAN